MTLRLSPEEALLVEAAGRRCAAPVAPARRPLDWDALLALARWHRMLPLLLEHLTTVRPQLDVPPGADAALREAGRTTTARNLRLRHERDRVLTVLAEDGIPVILLKGAALVEAVYPHLSQRPMVDLDLLVPGTAIRRAHAVTAERLGYTVVGTRLGRDDDALLATSQHHFPLATPDHSVLVELHHRIFDDRPGYDVDGIWARAVPGGDRPPYRLQAPEDLMLHVAAHFAFDRIHRGESALGQLADVVRIAERHPVDWETVAARARASQVGDRLFLTLTSAALLFGDLAAPAVTASLAPPSYTTALGERVVRERVLRGTPALPLEQLSAGRTRILARTQTLEHYVRPDEAVVPSRARLRARRWAALAGRLAREAPGPREFVRDLRLSRWMLSLRR